MLGVVTAHGEANTRV